MEFKVFDDADLLAEHVANEILELKRKKTPAVFCLAAGRRAVARRIRC